MTTWKPGMKAVCIKSKSNEYGAVIQGKVYPVNDVTACRCKTWLDVGVRIANPVPCKCTECGATIGRPGVVMASARLFHPLIEDLTAELARAEADRHPSTEQEQINAPQHAQR